MEGHHRTRRRAEGKDGKRKRGDGKVKRESRVLFIDEVGGVVGMEWEGERRGKKGALLAIVFRGGWIDCIAARRDPGGWVPASAWLEGQGFMLEVTSVSFGPGLAAAWGEEEAEGLSGWAAARGLEPCCLGGRNAAQADVISRGVGEYVGGAGKP